MTEIVDFAAESTPIDGLMVITLKQISDERGTIRELFRRSALQAVGIELPAFEQINVTLTTRGAVRGMHGEPLTKLVSVVDGEAFGAYIDLRSNSESFGVSHSLRLVPGVQVLVPPGVANGFQGVSPASQYVYCFDGEWRPDMATLSCSPLDPELGVEWPIPIDPTNRAQISAKDAAAASIRSHRKEQP